MISLYESLSCSVYAPWCISFICLRTVDYGSPRSLREKVTAVRATEATNLARFTSTEEKHLDFVASIGTVAPELALDLVVACWQRALS